DLDSNGVVDTRDLLNLLAGCGPTEIGNRRTSPPVKKKGTRRADQEHVPHAASRVKLPTHTPGTPRVPHGGGGGGERTGRG
ncbi:MAG: hypothetical protein O7E49_14880, partial [Gemmatimonadetes bacterium]|nr:hypothetical protein [Gemmatimonadota bacterium]